MILDTILKERYRVYGKELSILAGGIDLKSTIYEYDGPMGYEVVPFDPVYQKECYGEFLLRVKSTLERKGFIHHSLPAILESYWTFDNLGIPYYHADRNYSNTFYLEAVSSFERIPGDAAQYTLKPYFLGGVYKDICVLSPHLTAAMFKTLFFRQSFTSKNFSIGTVFRRQKEDSTHRIEFKQLEVTLRGGDLTLDSLYGSIRELAGVFGISALSTARCYYPFTEPSIECHFLINNRLVEVGGGGVFLDSACKKIHSKSAVGYAIGLERIFMALNNLDVVDAINEI
jgi:phenylalanyl-tRNA synthetase alpha chain